MSVSASNLERTKVVELAREYKSLGYRVLTGPTGADIPAFLRSINYWPDLIVMSERENIVIEVRSRESIKDAENLAKVSELIEQHENWEFLLVYTNPRRKRGLTVSPETQEGGTIHDTLSSVKTWVDEDKSAQARIAALLLLWSVLEASVTITLSREIDKRPERTPLGLIRDATIAGIISADALHFLERIMEVRNSAAHGNLSQLVSAEDLKELISICEELLQTNDGYRSPH